MYFMAVACTLVGFSMLLGKRSIRIGIMRITEIDNKLFEKC